VWHQTHGSPMKNKELAILTSKDPTVLCFSTDIYIKTLRFQDYISCLKKPTFQTYTQYIFNIYKYIVFTKVCKVYVYKYCVTNQSLHNYIWIRAEDAFSLSKIYTLDKIIMSISWLWNISTSCNLYKIYFLTFLLFI